MVAKYHLQANDLSVEFLTALKTLFKDKKISLTIKAEMDETEYLLASKANREALDKSLQNIEDGKVIEVDIEKYLQ